MYQSLKHSDLRAESSSQAPPPTNPAHTPTLLMAGRYSIEFSS
jgi:hypothetical protein